MAGGLLGQGSLTTYNPTFREKAADLLRGLLFSDDREGQRKAERLSNVLETITPYGVATGIDDMREAVGQGDYATAGVMGAMAMVPGPSPKIKAYHGSPHSFDRFDMSKIGTGEGAQAYGHGLYFAEAEDVARNYRDVLTNRMPDHIEAKLVSEGVSKDVANTYARWAAQTKGGRGSVEEFAAAMSQPSPSPTVTAFRQKVLAEMDGLRSAATKIDGSMYEVNINASPDDFLDWDKPLSEQPEKVRQAYNRHVAPTIKTRTIGENPNFGKMTDVYLDGGGTIGTFTDDKLADVLADPARFMPTQGSDLARNPEWSDRLKQAGIPGIKYLDAGSRGKGDGSRNYVVFDDKLIEIVRKYGIAGASAMLGYNVLNMVDPAQARQMQEVDAQRPQMARSGW